MITSRTARVRRNARGRDCLNTQFAPASFERIDSGKDARCRLCGCTANVVRSSQISSGEIDSDRMLRAEDDHFHWIA